MTSLINIELDEGDLDGLIRIPSTMYEYINFIESIASLIARRAEFRFLLLLN